MSITIQSCQSIKSHKSWFRQLHGGALSAGSGGKVETKEGEGTSFIIQLPVV